IWVDYDYQRGVKAVGILSGQLEAEPVVAGVEELFAQLNTYAEDFTDVRGWTGEVRERTDGPQGRLLARPGRAAGDRGRVLGGRLPARLRHASADEAGAGARAGLDERLGRPCRP